MGVAQGTVMKTFALISVPIVLSMADGPADAISAPQRQDATIDRTHATGKRVLRDILRAVGQIDGQPISDVRLLSPCRLVLSSHGIVTTINLGQVGNFAARAQGDRRVLTLDDGAGPHAISVPDAPLPEPIGDAAARLDSGLSVMIDDCQR